MVREDGDHEDGKPGLAQMAMDAVTSGHEDHSGAICEELFGLAGREEGLACEQAVVVGT